MFRNLKQCIVTLTRECNLRCSFCYAKKTRYLKEDYISYDDLLRIIDFCNQANVEYIVFTGGEPLLYPDLCKALKYIQNMGYKMRPTIATNGILLKDSKYCNDLVSLGVQYIDVSLKGSNSSEWLRAVGYDYYLEQLSAIKNISNTGINFTCSMIITHDNVHTFCDTVKQVRDCGGHQFSFCFPVDNSYSHDYGMQYLEKYNPITLMDNFLEKANILDDITDREWWLEFNYPLCMFTEMQLDMLEGRMEAPCHVFHMNGITYDTKMRLIPCSMYIEDTYGSFGSDYSTYDEFMKYIQNSSFLTDICDIAQMPSVECHSCSRNEMCKGGCPIFWKHCSFEQFKQYRDKHRTNLLL